MGDTIAHIIAEAAERLGPVTETPRLDAEILLAHALGISRSKLLARLPEQAEACGFEALLARRLNHEPLAYILGHWEFFSLDFKVTPPLLVPRPETEHLVEVVLEFVGERSARVFEIGAGTGCVSVSIAANAANCRVLASDINPVAIETASENARRHGVGERAEFRLGGYFECVRRDEGPFDVICSNPPYIAEGDWHELSPVIRKHEDSRALLAGPDGLDDIRVIAAEARGFLRAGGLLGLEIGAGQDVAVEGILREFGYREVGFRRDLAGIKRVALGYTD